MATPEQHIDHRKSALLQPVPPAGKHPSPPRGLPLGLSLGLILALAVSVVLGTITGIDQRRELAMERTIREARLTARLSDLGSELESVSDPTVLPAALSRLRRSAESASGEEHAFELSGLDGRPIAVAAPRGSFRPPSEALRAAVQVPCPALDGGVGRLAAWQSGDALTAERTRLWREWAMDLLITSLAVILVVELSVHLLVGRPLGRLVGGLKRLEQGHLGPIDPGPGAWEIRWLAWRFERLGRELSDNARRLVAAERRALDATRTLAAVGESAVVDASQAILGLQPSAEAGPSAHDNLARQYLEDSCRLLEALHPDDSFAHEIAEEAWSKAVVEAERLGDGALKARLEDAALRVLEHQAFAELDAELLELRRRRHGWSTGVAGRLEEVVQSNDVTVLEIQHRVKHTAGVWRKMREAELAVDQVHDLFAFRVIVPDERDCYLALAAVHGVFEPEPFRFKDYIETPKPNGYRSLHTTVRDSEGNLFEVQIRSRAMHDRAENGQAAHWRYRAERWGSIASIRANGSWRRRLRVPRKLFGR